MKLLIGTAFYEIKAYVPYLKSLMQTTRLLEKSGIEYDTLFISGDSYPDRAKNAIVANFYVSDFTDLLIIDSDMEWDIEGFTRILQSPYDFTGAAYPVKNNWEQYGCFINNKPDGTPFVDEKTGLISAHAVPGGFVRYTRKCISKMYEYCTKAGNYYTDPSSSFKGKTANMFECKVINGGRIGEDMEFCRKWRDDLGEKIWLEPRISFGHYGVQGWHGNYHEFLLRQPRPEAVN